MASRLGLGRKGKRWRRRLIWLVAAVAVGGGAFVMLSRGKPEHTYEYKLIARGTLAVDVSATGTLAPRDQVDVGSEVSGKIDKLEADFNDHVKKGQVLARINTDQLEAQLQQAEATLEQAQATLDQMTQTHTRYTELVKGKALSEEQLNLAKGDYGRAKAGVALAKAQVDQDKSMLSKATIYAPIDGVVLDRKVSAGQTVVAAMTTPVLFTLASDLTQMELDVDIDEADVGLLKAGAHAYFTVDAYPARRFDATLISIHNAPQTVQGVVTYRGVLLVRNKENLLKPGMTATAQIEAANLHNALLVPNAALRFVPSDDVKAKAPPQPVPQNGVNWGRVWISDGGKLSAHDVKLGGSDGKLTQVLWGDIKEGALAVTDTLTPKPATPAKP